MLVPYFLRKAAGSAASSAAQLFAAFAIVAFAAGVFFATHLPNAFDFVVSWSQVPRTRPTRFSTPCLSSAGRCPGTG